MNPRDTVTVGEVQLAGSWFAGFFLTTLTASSLLLCLCGLMTGWPERLAPAALAALAGFGVAVSATDPTVALMAAAAATTPAALVAGRVRSTPLGTSVGIAELRTLALVVVASTLAAATILNTNWVASDSTFILALAFLALAGAVAVRSGAVPFHLPAALLSRSGEGLGLVLSLVWVPSGFALVALSWNSTVFGVPGDWLDRAVLAGPARGPGDADPGRRGRHPPRRDRGDRGLLDRPGRGLHAPGPDRPRRRGGPARQAVAARLHPGQVGPGRLGGRRLVVLPLVQPGPAPRLAQAIAVAGPGPGGHRPGDSSAGPAATSSRLAPRSSGSGLPEPLRFAGTAAMLLALACYLRLLVAGLLPQSEEVRDAAGDRPHLPRAELRRRPTSEALDRAAPGSRHRVGLRAPVAATSRAAVTPPARARPAPQPPPGDEPARAGRGGPGRDGRLRRLRSGVRHAIGDRARRGGGAPAARRRSTATRPEPETTPSPSPKSRRSRRRRAPPSPTPGA